MTDQTLVTIQLGYGLIHLTDEKHGAPLIARLTGLRKQMCQNFGFVVPPFRIEDSFDVDPEAYRITLGGTPIGSGKLRANRLLAIDTGEVIDVSPELVMGTPDFNRLRLIVKQHLRKNTQATASDLRKAMNVTRRILIPVLEKLDRDGLTARRGDVRVLRRED